MKERANVRQPLSTIRRKGILNEATRVTIQIRTTVVVMYLDWKKTQARGYFFTYFFSRSNFIYIYLGFGSNWDEFLNHLFSIGTKLFIGTFKTQRFQINPLACLLIYTKLNAGRMCRLRSKLLLQNRGFNNIIIIITSTSEQRKCTCIKTVQ
ncbi:unnamed protein product [Discosporangium mesarthrocarpum]